MKTPSKLFLAALLASGLAAGAAAAPNSDQAVAEQVAIPFVNHGSIRNWQADKREGLWIQDTRGQWYYAKTMAPCMGLDFALSVGFDTARSGTLDRFGTVVVPHEGRCPIVSLTRSEGPPARNKAAKAAAAAAQTQADE